MSAESIDNHNDQVRPYSGQIYGRYMYPMNKKGETDFSAAPDFSFLPTSRYQEFRYSGSFGACSYVGGGEEGL